MRRKISTRTFEQRQIRVLTDDNGKVRWVNLRDICSTLERVAKSFSIDMEQIREMFPMNTKIPFKEGGRPLWAIKPYDLQRLAQHYKEQASQVKDGAAEELCERMDLWACNLPKGGTQPITRLPGAKTWPEKEFSYLGKHIVAFRSENGLLMVNATQMGQIFGKAATQWLNLAPTKKLRKEMAIGGMSATYDRQVMTTRGRSHGATWLEYRLGLKFAESLSLDFWDWCRDCIAELIKYGYVILEIEKDAEEEIIPELPEPQTFEDARHVIERQWKEICRLQTIIRENKPKVDYYLHLVERRPSFRSTQVADELGTTPRALHHFLREHEVCVFENMKWVVTPKYQSLQCNAPYMRRNKHGRLYVIGFAKHWTKEGRQFVLELWRAYHQEAPAEKEQIPVQ